MIKKFNAPRLRFPGFTDEWEQRKLGEIFEYLQNNTLSRNSLNYKNPNIKNIHYGDILVKFDEILDGSNKDIPYINSELDLSKFSKSLLRDGDVIFSDTAEDDTVGKAIELQNVNELFILSGLHTIPCRPLITFGKGYLGNFLNSNSYRMQLRPLVQGIKVSSISKSALKDTMIEYPKNLDEQEKIGSLFYHIAKMITLHQHKITNLIFKKKALLQKLFPINGYPYPEIRFPGFNDAWEQRKLGSIGSTYTGLSGKTKEDFGHGEAQYITYLNVFQNTISDITMTDKVEIDTTQNEVKCGDVLFTTSSETPEEVGMSSVWLGATPNIYLNSFCFGFRPNQKIDPYFLGYSLRAPYMRDKIKILAQGISRYNISKNKVMELEISLPNNEEQKLLGSFLQRIDLIITLHQRKLNHLKLQKKALLQQLFV